MPEFDFGFRSNPMVQSYRNGLGGESTRNPHTVVSLFAGCGGLDLGLQGGFRVLGREFASLPFQILSAIDNNPDAVETYNLNVGPECREADLTTLPTAQLPGADVLTGGFPCQDFSSSGPKVGLEGSRGQLYQVLTEYMVEHQPKVVIGENVPHLGRLSGGKYLEIILRDFEAAGYRFDVWDLYAPNFGVPQSRRRLFLIGTRRDLPGFPVQPRGEYQGAHLPIDVALEDLEGVSDETVTNQSQFFVATRASSGGGQGDHKNKVGEVAYCIRANARGRIQFHYKLDRRLTVRECARLQTFPDEFVFPFSTQRNLTLIGNAVPPVLAHAVAKSVSAYLEAVEEIRFAAADPAIDRRISRLPARSSQPSLFERVARG